MMHRFKRRLQLLVVLLVLLSIESLLFAQYTSQVEPDSASTIPTPSPTTTAPPTPSPTVTITQEATPPSSPLPSLRAPSPTPLPTPVSQPTTNPLCLNYGHQTNKYDLSQDGPVDQELKNIQASGITCLRLAYNDWNYSRMLDLAAFTKSMGFRVILGGHYGKVGESDLGEYRKQVLQQAEWAAAHNIDQFSLGNEQEFKMSISQDAWYDFLVDLADEVREQYSGIISYETSGNFFDFWLDQDLGGIDMVGFNMYSGYTTNARRLQKFIQKQGSGRVYVSESNADLEDVSAFRNDTQHAAEVADNTLRLLNFGIPVYFFTYATCDNGVENYWGLYQCGELAQPQTAQVLEIL